MLPQNENKMTVRRSRVRGVSGLSLGTISHSVVILLSSKYQTFVLLVHWWQFAYLRILN